MADIRGFKGVRYNQKKVKINNVVAPPYDVISSDEQNKLYKRDDHNVVRLILGKEQPKDTAKSNKYTRAKGFFEAWQNKDVLSQDENESLYIYRQDFKFDGKSYSRYGFIGVMKLEQLFKGVVYPHERTLSKPKADRLNLMQNCNANFSQVFGLYDDKSRKIDGILKKVMARKPVIDFKDWNKERNRMWVISAEKEVFAISKLMANKKIFIADGHHRYETALTFSKKSKNKNAKYVMTFLCDMNDKGLAIFPTHRLVNPPKFDEKKVFSDLEKYFSVEQISQKVMNTRLAKEMKNKNIAFCMNINSKTYLLILKNKKVLAELVKKSKAYRELDVAVLEELILKKILKFTKNDISDQKYIKYVKDLNESLKLVKNKKFKIAFIMNAPNVFDIKNIALAGETMPQKSTYFYPKLITGMVINKF